MSSDPETVAVYDAKAGEYAENFAAAKAGAHLNRFMKALRPEGAVLDLGCGPGGSAVFMRDAGFHVTCTDASAAMVEAARARGLEALQMTFDDISGIGVYDGIWANFSLLHAPRADFPRHFMTLSRALRPGGVFHIGMKAGTGEARDALGRRYTYVTVAEVCDLLRSVAITPDYRVEFDEVGLAGTKDPCLVVQGRKGG